VDVAECSTPVVLRRWNFVGPSVSNNVEGRGFVDVAECRPVLLFWAGGTSGGQVLVMM
jgi:hypothetical protein